MKSYAEKLKDPRWQKKRLKVLERDGWKCRECGDKNNTLNVHHLAYETQDPWDAENEVLRALCSDCHSLYHGVMKDTMGNFIGFEDITLEEFDIIYGHAFSLIYKIIGKENCIALQRVFFGHSRAHIGQLKEMETIIKNFFDIFINHYDDSDQAK